MPGGTLTLNKSLLDTDILSEISKAVDQVVIANAASYLQAYGTYTLSAVTAMEVIRGFQKRQSFRRLQAFV
jgi:tRNA(fMet)-specific endonuclease VapC